MNSLIINKKTIVKSSNEEQITKIIPDTAGLLLLRKGSSLLYHIRTNNLLKLTKHLFFEPQSDLSFLGNVTDKYNTIELRPAKDSFQALVLEKIMLDGEYPEYYGYTRLSDDYVYLALNAKQKPFISIRPDTIGDDWFIGPFRDRFFLVGVIELFCKYRSTPACKPFFKESTPNIGSLSEMVHKSASCGLDAEEEGNCLKYCLGTREKDLQQAVSKSYLDFGQSLLGELLDKHQELYDNLSFIQSDSIKKDIKTIKQYYRMLRFLTITKQINYCLKNQEAEFHIEDGLLVSYKNSVRETAFDSAVFNDYRSNERLAIPKESFQERFTLFEKLESVDRVYMERLFETESKKTQKLFIKENL